MKSGDRHVGVVELTPSGTGQARRLRMPRLSPEEEEIVKLTETFVDKRVRPAVRELEHSNTYPTEIIDQMKQHGRVRAGHSRALRRVGRVGPCFALVTEELARGWMSLAGAFGGHSVVSQADPPLRHRRAAAALPPADGDGRAPGHDGAHRARRRLRPAGDAHRRPSATATATSSTGRKTWITNARTAGLIALLCKTDPRRRPTAPRHQHPAGREGPGADRLARSAQARLQGRRELRAALRRLPRARATRCSAGRRAGASRR